MREGGRGCRAVSRCERASVRKQSMFEGLRRRTVDAAQREQLLLAERNGRRARAGACARARRVGRSGRGERLGDGGAYRELGGREQVGFELLEVEEPEEHVHHRAAHLRQPYAQRPLLVRHLAHGAFLERLHERGAAAQLEDNAVGALRLAGRGAVAHHKEQVAVPPALQQRRAAAADVCRKRGRVHLDRGRLDHLLLLVDGRARFARLGDSLDTGVLGRTDDRDRGRNRLRLGCVDGRGGLRRRLVNRRRRLWDGIGCKGRRPRAQLGVRLGCCRGGRLEARRERVVVVKRIRAERQVARVGRSDHGHGKRVEAPLIG